MTLFAQSELQNKWKIALTFHFLFVYTLRKISVALLHFWSELCWENVQNRSKPSYLTLPFEPKLYGFWQRNPKIVKSNTSQFTVTQHLRFNLLRNISFKVVFFLKDNVTQQQSWWSLRLSIFLNWPTTNRISLLYKINPKSIKIYVTQKQFPIS